MTTSPERHTLADWLSLHDLDPALCRTILAAFASRVDALGDAGPDVHTGVPEALNEDAAWACVVAAMQAVFASQEALIAETFRSSRKVRMGTRRGVERAATVMEPGADYPTIIHAYRGTPSDLMVLAHEFGHAVQMVASKGRFVPPVMREVCAFLAEIALLSSLRDNDGSRDLACRRVWRMDSDKYARADGDALAAALEDRAAPYRYAWNYPIARYIAIESSERWPRDELWMLFEGAQSVRTALDACARRADA